MIAFELKMIKKRCSAGLLFRKEVNLVILGFPHFVFWKKFYGLYNNNSNNNIFSV